MYLRLLIFLLAIWIPACVSSYNNMSRENKGNEEKNKFFSFSFSLQEEYMFTVEKSSLLIYYIVLTFSLEVIKKVLG